MEGRTTITSVDSDGEPMAPKGVSRTVVNQCGYYVRENIPINYKLWKKLKATDDDADVVPDTEKEMLWRQVTAHFNFPVEREEVFKKWATKKMAISF